jgi:hypothetical protein
MAFEPSAKWRDDTNIAGSLDGSAVKKSAVTRERCAAEDDDGNDPKSKF